MALKYKNVETQSAAEAQHKGSWGEILHEEARCVQFVRSVYGLEEIWTYPYETLLRWTYRKSTPEEIVILAGGDSVTIRGHGLERLADALDQRRLRRVEQRTTRFASAQPEECHVDEIKIDAIRS